MSAYSALVLATSGLVYYWRLGETSGTNAVDEMGALNGTYAATTTLNQASALTGDANPSINIASTTNVDAVALGTGAALALPFSVELWAKWTDAVNFKAAISRAGGSYNYELATSSGKMRFDCGSGNVLDPNTGTDGNWHHFVGTADSGGAARLYREGVLVAGPAGSGATGSGAYTARIGNDLNGRSWVGGIDEVALYNVALSSATVAQHYWVGRALRRGTFLKPRTGVTMPTPAGFYGAR